MKRRVAAGSPLLPVPTASHPQSQALVLDCSVTVPWYFESEATAFTNGLLSQAGLVEMHVPALWVLEFANAIRNAGRRGRIGTNDRRQILGQAAKLALKFDSTVLGIEEVSAIAEQHALTPYDAAYFELAQRRGLMLATLDKDLVRAARAARIALSTDLSIYPEPEEPEPKSLTQQRKPRRSNATRGP